MNYSNYTQGTFTKNCHTGNSVVYQHRNGRKLFIGGFNQGAIFDKNTFVIDLTGNEHKYWDIPVPFTPNAYGFMQYTNTFYAGWLSLPFPDFGTPNGIKTREQWEGITSEIVKKLQEGMAVLVACHGGHGRSGLVCAIVGYILNVDTDRTWLSPVEKIRTIHCQEAVETYTQEKYVYDILGLNIQIKHVYSNPAKMDASDPNNYGSLCPLCGALTYYKDQFGMCVACEKKWKESVPVKEDLTIKDIKAQVEHKCDDPNCCGIWTASICGHTTHNMLLYDGYCEYCWEKQNSEKDFADKYLAKNGEAPSPKVSSVQCAICEHQTHYSEKYGICYECAKALSESGNVEKIHNSITDPYKSIPHHCDADATFCNGVVQADGCGHVVHNREIIDGQCPACYDDKEAQ